jgi:zinc protease
MRPSSAAIAFALTLAAPRAVAADHASLDMGSFAPQTLGGSRLNTLRAVSLALNVQRARLANGLRVVMSVDHTSPTIAVHVAYGVGARDEARNEAGFVHLIEHLMFQGSSHAQAGEHFDLLASRGGRATATTTSDRTGFTDLVAENDLALALWLEADRMKSLDITQAKLDAQRAVVKEEIARRTGSHRAAATRLASIVFAGFFSYEHPAMPETTEISAATLDAVRRFHDRWYAPNEAVLAIAGDFDPERAMRLVTKYFADAHAEANPATRARVDTSAVSPRDDAIEDARATLATVAYGWPIPGARDPDHAAIDAVARLLARGESSRLFRALVREQSLATEVHAHTAGHAGADMLSIVLDLTTDTKEADVEKLVDGELANLAKLGPSDAEMTWLANDAEARALSAIESYDARAERLAALEQDGADAGAELAACVAVTKDDVKRVVTKYLAKERRSRVIVAPKEKPKSWDTATRTPNEAPSQ